MSEELSFGDMIRAEGDRRVLSKLVEDGAVSWRNIAEAPVFEVSPACKCEQGLKIFGDDLRCPVCGVMGVDIEISR